MSIEIKQKITKHCRYYRKSTNIKTAFSPFQVVDLFIVKESVPKYLLSFLVYKFTCPGCNTDYIGQTTHYLTTRIKEHSESEPKSHICKHLTNRIFKE